MTYVIFNTCVIYYVVRIWTVYLVSPHEHKAEDSSLIPAQMSSILAPISDKRPSLEHSVLHFQVSPEGVPISSHSAAMPSS